MKTAERKGTVEQSVQRKDAKAGLDPVLSRLSDLCRDPGHTSLGCLWLASCRQSVTGHGTELKLQICSPIAGGQARQRRHCRVQTNQQNIEATAPEKTPQALASSVGSSTESTPMTLQGFYRPRDPLSPGPKSGEVQGEGLCWARGPEGTGGTRDTGSRLTRRQ